ncbi:glutamate--tRNA ligase [candidate division WOR-1 bacterium RIFOXYA2_FULL_36_21]|uniref:Glutamate--tRNA ligase n=1 Tax=candidate division WOR-1 bacterium RIFOXYB2_FULL_36_35 TaxID=1802578 RepID=A0A1F4S366_UNCSA|nr:MAG: glutamate--tRNA ligase [candidate division WOR-1 bacterium RIFOXYA2_FULL_36_21]OGC14183.1 MAG: glutamate--tRNA ligase [candidate division WOR-1 bacterium RIFOXYB2_FULL_36_35]OGC19048.1 MAG: glutamate--tRNA ligase [candidate division WOR-1 bacterium RIFOXYA12_FULL_36_13]
MTVRTRFAPSPTGALHVGGARTALFNWLFARIQGGKFILRIEDTDKIRSTNEAIKAIYDGMGFLGLDWDEGPKTGGDLGPYMQTERLNIYKEYTEKLLKEGKAYYCFCTTEELNRQRKEAAEKKEAPKYNQNCRRLTTEEALERIKNNLPYVIRFSMPPSIKIEIDDLIRGKVVFDSDLLDDFVIMKSDGFPTYNFAAVVDDHLMKITHIIRGDDHLSNTPRQIVLYEAFGFKLPKFAHIPMILGNDKKRLSKRHGATSVIDYKDMGYLPEAMINYLARLGWGHKDEELFSRDELLKMFSLEGVTKNPAIFDMEKLNWLNGQYIRKAIPERIVDLCEPLLINAYENHDIRYISKIVALFLDRLVVIPDIVGLTEYFFKDDFSFTEKGLDNLKKEGAIEILKELREKIPKVEPFNKEELEKTFKGLAAERGVKLGVIIHPCRAALTGRTESPGIYDVIEVLGKEKTVKRIDKTLSTTSLVNPDYSPR